MERLFVAAWPDAATSARLTALPRPDEPGIRWTAPEQWHVTLRFLGTCDRDEAVDRLARAEMPAATARLGPAVERLGPQLVVPVAGVDELAATVDAATHGIGEGTGESTGESPRPRFRGHLTLARTRRGAASTVLGHPVSGSFAVDEIALVRSDLTPDGPRYTTVATFPTVRTSARRTRSRPR